MIPMVGRRLATELRSAPATLPAGTDVIPAISLVHTAGGPLPRAESLPAGALPRREVESYAWIPFGGGTRRCLGAAFAEFEMRIVLQTVLAGWSCARQPQARAAGAAKRHSLATGRHPGARHGGTSGAEPASAAA